MVDQCVVEMEEDVGVPALSNSLNEWPSARKLGSGKAISGTGDRPPLHSKPWTVTLTETTKFHQGRQ